MNAERAFGSDRGAAATEFAVSLLVFIPTLFYALFLDDALRTRLDAQEAVISTLWDFTSRDWYASPQPEVVATAGREMFCDFNSARQRDCKAIVGLSANATWSEGGAREVRCTAPDAGIAKFRAVGPEATNYARTYGKGGYVECTGRAAVHDHLLPKQFLTVFSGAEALSTADVFPLQPERAGILVDTWAMNVSPDADPNNRSGPLWDRVDTVYRKNVGAIAAIPLALVFQLGALEFVNPLVLFDPNNDPTKPTVAVTHKAPWLRGVKQEGSGKNYETIPSSSKDLETFQRRGNHYLGCRNANGRGC